MASLGVLASLMQGLTPTMPQYNPMEEAQQRTLLQGRRMGNETSLLQLADLKNKQAAEQEMFAAIQQNPALAQQFFGAGPVLGSLQTAPGGTGAGPMMQQTTIPGQPPRAPQVIPGGQDLSQFATQGAPQSTLASLGPQPQGPIQAPRNPVLEMAQRSPQAAFLMQQQMEAREAQQFKMQEQRLKMGTAAVEHVGQLAQGVTDQASLDAMRADLVSSGLGKYAAQLPQFYSKGAMEPFIAKATSVKDSLLLQTDALKAQAELTKARMGGRVASTNEYLIALGVTPGTERREDMQRALELKNKHLAEIEAGKVNPQIIPGPGGEYWAVNPRTLEQRPVGGGGGAGGGAGCAGTGEQLRAPMTEGQSKTAVYTSTMQTGHDKLTALEQSGDYTSWKAPAAQLPGGKLLLTDKQREYETAKGVFLTGLLRYQSAGQITPTEWKDYGALYFPEPNDPPAQVEFKKKNREAAIKTMGGALGRPLPGQSQAQPTSQGTTGGTASTAWLETMAKKYNISLDEAKKKAAAAGVKVE